MYKKYYPGRDSNLRLWNWLQERLKPQEEKNEEERSKVDDLRGERRPIKKKF